MRNCRTRRLKPNSFHGAVKAFAIFCLVYRVLISADEFNTKFFEHAFANKIQGTVKRRLTAHSGQQCLWPLLLDDLGNGAPFNRFDVGGIRHRRVGHDGCWIGINQHNPITLVAQGLARLGAGIVKFARLANNNWPGAQNHDGFKVVTPWH